MPFNNVGHEGRQVTKEGDAAGAALRTGALPAGVKQAALFALDLGSFRVSPAFWEWIDGFAPAVVYGLLGSNRVMKLTREICSRRGIRVVPHFMDDWIAAPHQVLPGLQGLQSSGFQRELKRVLTHCGEGMAISDAMAMAYSRRLGLPMTAVANGIEDVVLYSLRDGLRGTQTPGGPFRFSLIGRLGYSRLDLLRRIVAELERQSVTDRKFEVSVYSESELPPDLSRAGVVTVTRKAPLADGELDRLQRQTDCLLHVDSFGRVDREYFRLSLSAKIPLCLSIGRPILTIGPADGNSVAYLRSCKVGPAVVANDSASLREGLTRVLEYSPAEREALGRRAWEIAEREHRIAVQRGRLKEILLRNAVRNKQATNGTKDY